MELCTARSLKLRRAHDTPTTFDESDCIARAQRGDVAAFSELVAHHQDRIYRFLLRLTRSHDDALDLAQETFIHAWTSLDRWQARSRFSTWLLFQIARNQAIDLLRRTQRVDFCRVRCRHGR